MDRKALRESAEKRRGGDSEAPVTTKKTWRCTFCEHDYASERTFMNHRCRERERLEQLKSPIGQAAYSYYSEWMRLNKRAVPAIERFADSSFYTTFIKFAEWVVRVRLPNPSAFIRSMVTNGNLQPSLWCRDNTYALYIQGYDSVVTPTQQFVQSLDEISCLISELNCAPADVFSLIGVDSLLELVQKRKLSPWFLASSGQFRRWWSSLPPFDARRIEDVLQVGSLMLRISKSETLKAQFAEFGSASKEVGL